MSTWVFGAERWDNLIYYALGGHKDAIVACFFESNSLDVCPVPEIISPATSPGNDLGAGLQVPFLSICCFSQLPGNLWGLTVATLLSSQGDFSGVAPKSPHSAWCFPCSCTPLARTEPCVCGSVTRLQKA
jgi:hypothetical protein